MRFFHLSIDRRMNNAQHGENEAFFGNARTRMTRGKEILLDSVERVCRVFGCIFRDELMRMMSDGDHGWSGQTT